MPLFDIETGGHIFRDSPSCVRPRQAYFPSLIETQNGELLAGFDMGSGMESADVRTCVCRSADGGRTWSEPAPIYDPAERSYPASTLGRISRLSDGTLVALLAVCDRSRSESRLANPETEGYVETSLGIVESRDDGRSWSAIRRIEPPIRWNAFEICSPVLEIPPDRWVVPTSTWRAWDGSCPWGMKAVAFVSGDRGNSWNHCAEVMSGWDARVASWEQKQAILSDGRVLAVCWAYSYGEQKSLPNRYALSSDQCRTFGPACEAPVDGETCTPLAMSGSRVLCAYRRIGNKGLWLHLGRIEGERWVPIDDELLWGGRQASYGIESSSKTEEMGTLQFGYPQLLQLRSGKIMLVFWCVEDGMACIRWFRIRLEGFPA